MTKLIALAAAGILAAGTVFAGEHGDCTRQVGNKDKVACNVSMANLNLTAEQKAKMDTAISEHHKAGCNKASEARFMSAAEGILTKEQLATFKAEAKGAKAETEA